MTALIYAVGSGDSGLVKYLISKGVDVNVVSKDGTTLSHGNRWVGDQPLKPSLTDKLTIRAQLTDRTSAKQGSEVWGYTSPGRRTTSLPLNQDHP